MEKINIYFCDVRYRETYIGDMGLRDGCVIINTFGDNDTQTIIPLTNISKIEIFNHE